MKTELQKQNVFSRSMGSRQKVLQNKQFVDRRDSMAAQAKMINQIHGSSSPVSQLATQIRYTQGDIDYWQGGNNWGTQTVGIYTEAFLDPRDPKTGSRTAAGQGIYQNGHYNLVQGHLLNANLGGQAIDENLFPITPEMNRAHSVQIEQQMKAMFLELYGISHMPGSQNRRLCYRVQVDHPNFNDIRPATIGNTSFIIEAFITRNTNPHGNGGETRDPNANHIQLRLHTPADLNQQLAGIGFAPDAGPTHQIGAIVGHQAGGGVIRRINDGGGHPVPGITVAI